MFFLILRYNFTQIQYKVDILKEESRCTMYLNNRALSQTTGCQANCKIW